MQGAKSHGRRRWGRQRPLARVVGVLVLAGLAAVAQAAKPAPEIEAGRLTVAGEHVLQIEVARTAEARARGLMERDSLADDAGMLFVYASDQPATSAYWMYRTRIPLDIAFVDGDGVIQSLKTMPPCRAERSAACPIYPAGAPFRAALETNAGYFSAHGVDVGDRITLDAWLSH
ncbi:DUF192 domain-containing protein [Salinicola avicenniae]|uniref:DUF192 domain-containing protein n=1 Tax=Salinicola avicenniae TaxID=2916836 RepID=UPI002072EDA3|nr:MULTISPECIES: DUF192 domain-containing protein [unclassified Salinicola]